MTGLAPVKDEAKEVDLSSPISKALVVLDAVASAEKPPRFMDLLGVLPLSRATLHRMLRQLTAERMLAYDDKSQTYRMGLRLLRLAHSAWTQTSLAGAAQEALDALSLIAHETIHLAVLDNFQVLYVDKRVPQRSVSMFSSPGKIGPAYCTGVGKAMLSALPEGELNDAIAAQRFQIHTSKTHHTATALRRELNVIRERGFAYDDEEHEDGIICISMPILNRAGYPLGALSITSTTYMTSLEEMTNKYLSHLREAARIIAQNAEIQMNS